MADGVEDRLREDMKAALRAGPDGRAALSVIRLARAELQNAAIEKRRPLTDEEAAEVLTREVKQRREAAEEYRRLRRTAEVERLEAEIAVIERYLPEQLSDDELGRIVARAIEATGASGPRDLGKVMGKVMPEVRGRADGRRVKELVRKLLADA